VNEPRTKIVCTVGPASESLPVLQGMVKAGADVFRVNGAHADEAAIPAWVGRIRKASEGAERPVAVLVDLPGTKLRLGALAGGVAIELRPGAELDLEVGTEPGTASRLPLRAVPFVGDVPVGASVLLGEGGVRFEVLRAYHDRLRVRVVEGGPVRSRMGVHFPGSAVGQAVPTERDRALARAAVDAGADLLGLSFVRSVDDVVRMKEALAGWGARQVPVVVKVERLEAVQGLDGILRRADAVIVARGDLGVDAGPERVPSLQRRILEGGRRAGRPVIVATEMLESMTKEPRPTRAEASDVAGAVFEGADAVMLSAETAIGVHPVRVVETMARILAAAEEDPSAPYAGRFLEPPAHRAGRPDQHVVRAAVDLARQTEAEALVVFTRSGVSAVRMSKERPEAPIHAFAPSDDVCRRLALAWGVVARRLPDADGGDDVPDRVSAHLRRDVGLKPGSRAVLVMGSPTDPAGATTQIHLLNL
jgi:pyruvate kinase